MYDSSSHDSESTSQYADKDTSEEEDVTEDATLKEAIDREVERTLSQTPMLTSPIGCSTEIPQTTDATRKGLSEKCRNLGKKKFPHLFSHPVLNLFKNVRNKKYS